MKTQTLFFALALSLGANAFAAAPKKATKTLSGAEAQKLLTSNLIDVKDGFEGDGCLVEAKMRGQDMEIIFNENGHQKVSIEIFADTQYTLNDKSKDDDQVLTLSAGKAEITMEQADDAFNVVSATVNGVSSSCEQDM